MQRRVKSLTGKIKYSQNNLFSESSFVYFNSYSLLRLAYSHQRSILSGHDAHEIYWCEWKIRGFQCVTFYHVEIVNEKCN